MAVIPLLLAVNVVFGRKLKHNSTTARLAESQLNCVALLDGLDVRAIKLDDLRRHVALVLQDCPVVPATIRENIAYGRPDALDDEIHQAAQLAGASTFVERLPLGYDTVLSEAGQNLSGGQRQRIAIARALLTQAPIIVFDEPTSALDPAHEEQFTATVRALRGQRTIIMVSHRLSTVQHSDQIFVLDHGRVVERVTHPELLALQGRYWQMAQAQFSPTSCRLPLPASAA